MLKLITDFLRIRNSDVLHKISVAGKCHYVLRSTFNETGKITTIKKRTDRICDECQRLEKLAKQK